MLDPFDAMRIALDDLVGAGAQHERTCDPAEHDQDSPCVWCAARTALLAAETSEQEAEDAADGNFDVGEYDVYDPTLSRDPAGGDDAEPAPEDE